MKKSITLKVNGRDFYFHLGLGLIGELLEHTGLEIDELKRKIDTNYFKWLPLVMFHSARYGCERKDEEVDFDKYLFIDWFEDSGGLEGKLILAFYTAFNNSLVNDVPKEPVLEQESKKK